MKIIKQWIVMVNGYYNIIVKTKKSFFIMETTNITGFVKIDKQKAKDLIKRNKNNNELIEKTK